MFASGKLDAATAPSHGTLGRGPRCLVERSGTIRTRSSKNLTLLAAPAMMSTYGGGHPQAPPADPSTTELPRHTHATLTAAETTTITVGQAHTAGARLT